MIDEIFFWKIQQDCWRSCWYSRGERKTRLDQVIWWVKSWRDWWDWIELWSHQVGQWKSSTYRCSSACCMRFSGGACHCHPHGTLNHYPLWHSVRFMQFSSRCASCLQRWPKAAFKSKKARVPLYYKKNNDHHTTPHTQLVTTTQALNTRTLAIAVGAGALTHPIGDFKAHLWFLLAAVGLRGAQAGGSKGWPVGAGSEGSREENESLLLAFTREEIDAALRSMKSDTAPSPNGWLMAMFKSFWPAFKEILFAICNGFALGTVDIWCLNYGILSLF